MAQLKRTSAGAVTESTLRTFDVLDRLKTITRYDSKLTTYGYDAKGNRTSVTDFQNVATTYTFDALDRLETTVTPEGTTTSSYFPDSLPKTVAFFNGLHESHCYDAAGRLLKLSTGRTSAAANPCAPANLVTQYGYSFDADGNRLTQDEVLTPPGASSPTAPSARSTATTTSRASSACGTLKAPWPSTSSTLSATASVRERPPPPP